MKQRVLVLDAWTRKALSVVRSLGRSGVEVDAAAHTRLGAPLYSKFVKRRLLVPSPEGDPGAFAARVGQLLDATQYDCLLALEDSSLEALLPLRQRIEERAAFPVPPDDALAVASDKWRTTELARELGIPVPRSVLVSTRSDAAMAVERLTFPLIVKPTRASGSRGMTRVGSREGLSDALDRALRHGDAIVQEALPADGPGVGVGVLADRGSVRVMFSYRRLREFPVGGGPSTLRESTDDPAIKSYAKDLFERLRWHGVGMAEFKIDQRSGIPKLLEVNPRFWGSLELANAAGVNFPDLLLQVATGHPVEQPGYRVGVRCRWLIPGDIAHFIANPRRMHMEPSFFRFFARDMAYDEFAWDDVRGGIATVFCTALSAFDPQTWRLGVFRS